jgi:hypothetical protein
VNSSPSPVRPQRIEAASFLRKLDHASQPARTLLRLLGAHYPTHHEVSSFSLSRLWI